MILVGSLALYFLKRTTNIKTIEIKTMNNFIRNPTNNEVINKIINKYKLVNELGLSRIEKKELKKQLFIKYQEVKELIKLKSINHAK